MDPRPRTLQFYVNDLSATLSGNDVVGRASAELHAMIERITVHCGAEMVKHHLDLEGDIVALLSAGDNKKAAALSGAAGLLRMVA